MKIKVEKKPLIKLNKKQNIKKKSKKSENEQNENLEDSNTYILMKKSKKKEENFVKKNKLVKKKESEDDELKKHKKELKKLKDIDPEFYKFLKQNDKKLLEFNFGLSDDSGDDNDNDSIKSEDDTNKDDDEEDEDNEKFHKPSEDLEVASDESDFEADDDDEDDEDKIDDGTKTKTISLKLLKEWEIQLQKKHPSIEIIRKAIQAFSSALASLSGDESKALTYKVEGSAAFNGIIQLCVLHLQPAILNFLGISEKSKQPLHKCKKWKKIRTCLRGYLIDLVRLLEHVSSTNILIVLLKHLHQMANMIGSFSTISKTILKRLIVLWSTSEETVRVLSFLCILKITRGQQIVLLNHILKAMYLSYVRNSKFVSPNTLANINFMRRSLVEMFALDLNISYQHVFLYIRQLAIHLRNAIILKKKDSFQAVYNWQFVNSIRLWSELLGATSDKPQLQPLIYPLISITIGVIKLIPTAQFFPLRFHCIQALINLQCKTDTFIPILPFIVEVLNSSTFNKKHTIVSMKPMQFTCILRLNKSQMAENGFRDEVIENVCGLTLQYLENESASLAFPDLIVPTVHFLKKYLKECKNSNHSRKLKQLVDKIMENTKLIEKERENITFTLDNVKEIRAWEARIRSKGTPLNVYYSNWIKTHEIKRKRQAANTDEINTDYDIPFIKRKRTDTDGNQNINNKNEEVELFPSDEDDDNNQDEVALSDKEGDSTKKSKKVTKKQKKQPRKNQENDNEQNDKFEDDGVDIVKDLDIDEW